MPHGLLGKGAEHVGDYFAQLLEDVIVRVTDAGDDLRQGYQEHVVGQSVHH